MKKKAGKYHLDGSADSLSRFQLYKVVAFQLCLDLFFSILQQWTSWNLTVKQTVGKKYPVIQAVTFSSPSWGSPTTFDFGSRNRKGCAFTIPKRSQRIARSRWFQYFMSFFESMVCCTAQIHYIHNYWFGLQKIGLSKLVSSQNHIWEHRRGFSLCCPYPYHPCLVYLPFANG